MGVAFAEVSPDICFCFNTCRHRGAVFIAAGRVRYCYAGSLYAGSVGPGPAPRHYLLLAEGMAGGALRGIVGADALSVA